MTDEVGGTLRVFKTRAFGRFARKERIFDTRLCEAIDRAERGTIDAELGGHVIKQRVARSGQGRSGGFRTLIAYRAQSRAVFIFGFAKNDQGNIDGTELTEVRKAVAEMLGWTDNEVDALVAGGKWTEINCDA